MPSDRVLNEEQTIKVSALRQGTVIDHLRKGTGLRVLDVLGLSNAGFVAVGLNLESSKLGHKDLIKIENRELTQEETNKIALLSPEATLSIIRDFKVVSKLRPQLSDAVDGVLRCLNPACITNHEHVRSRFRLLERSPLRLRCAYCERAIAEQEIELL